MANINWKEIAAFTLLGLLSSCTSHKQNETSSGTFAVKTGPAAPGAYTPRIGVAVNTGARTCMAIGNPSVAASTPVTLVSPLPPQTFVQAEVAAPSEKPCPITKDVDLSVSNYEIRVSGSVQKLTPVIAVLGSATLFSMAPNNTVQADLDQNSATESFRVCGANDGFHLTVWAGNPVTGTLLWHAYYYEPSNPGLGPTCAPQEIAGP